MSNKKLSVLCAVICASMIAASFLMVGSGCATSKVVTQGTNGPVTNTVVNEAVLAVDCAGIQAVTAVIVSQIAQRDPSIIPAFKDAETGLAGVINGASTNSTSQILSVLGQSKNQTLATQINPLVNTISQAEQNLLTKYGASAAGEITIAVAKAVSGGFAAGLGGQ